MPELLWLAGYVLIWVVGFLAWRRERRKLEALKARIARLAEREKEPVG